MTSKDYMVIAEAIRGACSPAFGACDDSVFAVALCVAAHLERKNPRFDFSRFITACGFEDVDSPGWGTSEKEKTNV